MKGLDDLQHLIFNFLSKHPNLKGREIAKRISKDRQTVNAFLDKNRDKFQQDENYQWSNLENKELVIEFPKKWVDASHEFICLILGEYQLDLVLKYLPLIIFIYPILSWVDSRKRFSHNAKFYSDRASSVKQYKEECSRDGVQGYEKSAFAQALAGTDKLGYRDIDIIKLKFPDHFFIMISKIQKIRDKITIEKLNN